MPATAHVPLLKRTGRALAIASSLFALGLSLSGCPKSYPDCDDDSTCRSRQEVCVDGRCRQCKDDTQCDKIDACMSCQANECVREPGCCKSDLDCPGGRCWKKTGQQTGQCGGACQVDSNCPAGQRCASGACVPDIACSDDSFCPNGQKCVSGKCVIGCDLQPVYFDFNEYAIRLDMEPIATANSECLKQSGFIVGIEGHCDERGSDEYNLALGQRRAATLARHYKTLGVSGSQLKGILSFGEERPVCNDSNESCWKLNRRGETVRK